MNYNEIKKLKEERSVMFLTRPISIKSDENIVTMLNAASIEYGHNVHIPEDSFLLLCADGTFFVEWEDDTTQWEYSPNTGMTRHCGFGEGSFWTEWE